MPRFSRPALIVDAEQFRITEPARIPGVCPVVLDVDTGKVRGEYVTGATIPHGFRLGFAVWTKHGWDAIVDGDWIVQTGRELQVWDGDRFLTRFTRLTGEAGR